MFGRDQFDVRGQSVMIAGGSKGLGKQLALQLAAQGASVTIVARTPRALEETLQELRAHAKTPEQTLALKALDLTDAAAVQEYIN